MKLALAQIAAAGWPFAASLAAAVTAQGLWAGRRRSALNEAMHELRRPLQALALAAPDALPAEPSGIERSVQMAAVALERLEREVNGEGVAPARAPVLVAPLLASAAERWKARAALAGGSLQACVNAAGAVVNADRCDFAQALDNLIVNAIEHGGPAIAVEAQVRNEELRVCVVDSGRAHRPDSHRKGPAELIARLSGRRRRGHGLRVVRRMAAAHGGGFRLRLSERRTEAILELPLLREDGAAG